MNIPDVLWQSSLVISKGGTYTGNFKGLGDKPALEIVTEEPVTIINCNLSSEAETILFCYGGHNVKILNNRFWALQPNPDRQYGRAINAWGGKSIIIEHNEFYHTGGVMIEQSKATVPSVIFRFNKSLNVDKRRGNGSTGDHRAFLMISTILNMKDSEIAWNESINNPNESYIEDNINIYNSGGTADSPLLIHNNYIKGAYPFPATATSYSGSGITVDGTPSNNSLTTISSNIIAYDNQVLECANACMNIATGHNIVYKNNAMMGSGVLADGTRLPTFWGGCAVFNSSNVPEDVFSGTIKDNLIGYMSWGRNYPFPNRQDETDIRGMQQYDNRMPRGGNVYLPEGSVTYEAVGRQADVWQKKLNDAGITIGVGENISSTTTTTSTKVPRPIFKIPLNKKGQIKFTPLNSKGIGVGFKSGSVSVTTNDFFQAIPNKSNQTIIDISPQKEGNIEASLSYISIGGKTITKFFIMEIEQAPIPDTEPVDTKLEFILI